MLPFDYQDRMNQRVESMRQEAELQRQLPHHTWRHLIAVTLRQLAARLEPDS